MSPPPDSRRSKAPGLVVSLMATGATLAISGLALWADQGRLLIAVLVMGATVAAVVVGLLGLTRLLERWAGDGEMDGVG